MPVRKRTIDELYSHSLFVKAGTMRLILSGYRYFKPRENLLCCIGNPQTYESAENTSYLIKCLFNRDICPADLMETDDEMANEIIRLNQIYRIFERGFNKFDNSVLVSFYKYIYYRYHSPYNAMDDYLTWPEMLMAFDSYARGNIDLKTLKENIGFISLFQNKFVQKDSKGFRRDMINLYRIFREIYAKKVKRAKGSIRRGIKRSTLNMED